MGDAENAGRKRSRAGRWIAVLMLLILVVGASGIGMLYFLNSPPSREPGAPVSFTIERGENLASISRRLESLGLIRSGLMLRLIARMQGTARRVQSGNYLFEDRLSAREMHDYLLTGNQVLKRVTIPEGLTLSKTAAIVEEAGITSARAFISAARDPALLQNYSLPGDSAEGFLFPDTYLFAEGYPAAGVVEHLIERFFAVLEEVYPQYESLTAEEIHEKVVIASIVEREYRVPDEAATIASVFYNRLEENMRLESCATVVYVMTEIEDLPHPQRLFYRDLERANPYNTYRSRGLPPGPIANPGRTALDAAFHPESTDYRFFVWNGPGSGRHSFTRTLSEHNEARLLYLKAP